MKILLRCNFKSLLTKSDVIQWTVECSADFHIAYESFYCTNESINFLLSFSSVRLYFFVSDTHIDNNMENIRTFEMNNSCVYAHSYGHRGAAIYPRVVLFVANEKYESFKFS